jgi:hypothetical protein
LHSRPKRKSYTQSLYELERVLNSRNFILFISHSLHCRIVYNLVISYFFF